MFCSCSLAFTLHYCPTPIHSCFTSVPLKFTRVYLCSLMFWLVCYFTSFQRGFGFLKTFHVKKNVEEASKNENSKENLTSIWELHDARELRFETLVLALSVILEIKNKTRTSFKVLLSRKQEHDIWKETQFKDKYLWKTMSSSYHMK